MVLEKYVSQTNQKSRLTDTRTKSDLSEGTSAKNKQLQLNFDISFNHFVTWIGINTASS